ncbi:MAG: ATP-binding cassette domain-containing protein [Bacteroidaceae bacterium]|nr:ATP-binding cassette domain-containing protein [Bacteroidaceae bacterium]
MISIQNVKFGYRSHQEVLDDFSLDFAKNGIYGLLGKNGTGKSTLLYLMMGLLRPQKGSVTIDGISSSLRKPEVLQEMFLVPEEYDLPRISLKKYVKSIKPFYPHFSDELLEKSLANFEMTSDIDLGSLSMGQKKKVYMSIALAANTRYLLLDEPTNGLDILSKSQFRKAVIEGMNDEKTIIVSTHQVHDVERLLDQVCIIERNKVLLNEPLVENEESSIDLEELFIKTVSQSHETV